VIVACLSGIEFDGVSFIEIFKVLIYNYNFIFSVGWVIF